MHSDGGLVDANDANGVRAVLSGPSAGVIAITKCVYPSLRKFFPQILPPIISFDMGGTSTDVSRFDGRLDISTEGKIAGYPLYVPHLNINSVAAGGGSQLFFTGGMFAVGPDSAKAIPGPACYRQNGPATVTDANVVLGRLPVAYLPKLFGPNKDQPMDEGASVEALQKLTKKVNDFHRKHGRKLLTLQEVALGYVKVANEAMTRPILSLTQEKGYDTSQHVLCCFGGAGGLHACSMAKSLNIGTVFIHTLSGILSSYGLYLSNIQMDQSDTLYFKFPSYSSIDAIEDWSPYEAMLQSIRMKIRGQEGAVSEKLGLRGFGPSISFSTILYIRYEGVENHIQMDFGDVKNAPNLVHTFVKLHHEELGFTIPGSGVIIEGCRTIGVACGMGKGGSFLGIECANFIDFMPLEVSEMCVCTLEIWYEVEGMAKCISTPIYDIRTHTKLMSLTHTFFDGPCLLCDRSATILVEPNWRIFFEKNGYVLRFLPHTHTTKINKKIEDPHPIPDPITLAIFGHRFMGIAEQMGKMLQRIASSVNIKQRLDFSCAIFGSNGNLVANAAHIPAHLGAMQEAVKYQIGFKNGKWEEGEVTLCNHPAYGGIHLPDLTVITPIWGELDGVKMICFFVASRGHHIDVGGIVPGSMPAFSTDISQEGAAIKSFKIVVGGIFQDEACRALFGYPKDPIWVDLAMEGGNVPANPPSRRLDDVMGDLRAQIAANQRGVALLTDLIEERGLKKVLNYTQFIQDVSKEIVKDTIDEIVQKYQKKHSDQILRVESKDYLDDGSLLHLNLTLDTIKRQAIFDFGMSSHEIYGNTNAPRGVVKSAIIYSLRTLIKRDIPLNQGCMEPITIIFPQNSFLNPSPNAAVVAGNVTTSQRIIDVILRAFNACSNSYGCMNNFTFGSENLAFYETIGGGCGAGPNWHGTNGVHCHMTNTRITDVETIERLYPVCLISFGLRHGSGGCGRFCGGHGLYREFEFLKDNITVNVLSERRSRPPNGLEGGENGKMGRNLWIKYPQGQSLYFHMLNIGGKAHLIVNRGDRIIILTPGGGGYGSPN